MKWMIFPALTFILGLGIIYNSVQIFGVKGSVPYIGLILGITIISLIMVIHTGNHNNEAAKKAAFIFEGALLLALIVTCICSIYVARTMSGNQQSAATDRQNLEVVSKMDKKAQRTFVKAYKPSVNMAEAFNEAEMLMFWPLVFETLVAFLALMTVFGLVIFKVGERGQGEYQGDSGHSAVSVQPVLSGRMSAVPYNAPFSVGSLPGHSAQYAAVTNGAGATFSFKRSGQGYGLHFRERGGNSKHVVYLSASEAPIFAAMDYEALARDAAKKRESRHGQDGVVRAIEQTLI